MRPPATADALAVLVALYWVHGVKRRATLRGKLDAVKAASPAQYAAVVRTFPSLREGHERGESLMIPAAVAVYAMLRMRGRS